MALPRALILALQLTAVFGLPALPPQGRVTVTRSGHLQSQSLPRSLVDILQARGKNKETGGGGANTGAAGGANGAGGETKEEEGEADEIVLTGAFGQPVQLKGGNVKQDTEFPASVGKFEVEFQNTQGATLDVTQNESPGGSAPEGFQFLDPTSFTVNIKEGGSNLTLSKIDYIFDTTNLALTGVDLSKSAVAKLCADSKVFIADAAIGEREFEADENEIVLNAKDINGEWAILIPAAAGSNGGEGAAADGKTGAEIGDGQTGNEEAGEADGTVDLTGAFKKNIAVEGGFKKQDILYPASTAGSLEVEYNGTAANTINVVNKAATITPPAGFLYVDGQTFTIKAQGAPAAGDVLKVDYIFTEAVKAAIDPSKGVIGKLDPATNQFITAGLGEFDFEADENEWTLTVADLNGEWAVLVPQAAVVRQ